MIASTLIPSSQSRAPRAPGKKASAFSRQILLDFFLVFLYTAILIRPYFKANYENKWASIESTFIADARFLAEHWPHPQWQPLWYAGTRFDYIYPPAVRYGTAVISKVTGFWPVKAYHFYVAFFYALGIAGVYLLMRVGSKSRPFAYLGALATSLMSPIFLFLPRFRDDAWMLQPQRLGVLVKYGDGPHMSALALIPIALAFGWLALEKHRPWAVALAAVFSAGVAANNFFGAIALATFYPILVWSLWITRREKRIVVPAIAIPVLAYGLTAFWLVPSYFQVPQENLKYVSEHGTLWLFWVAVVVAVAFVIVSDRFARARPERAWAVFIAGCVVFFSLKVFGGLYFNLRISGEPARLLPELDMIYIMAAALILQWLWDRPGIALRAVVLVVLCAAFWTTTGYIRHAWHMFPLSPDYQNHVEYRVTDWLWKNMPDARVFPSGSVRFWYDAWHDLPQLGGGSDQGLLNGEVASALWQTHAGAKPEPAILWMQCMGVDAIYVSDQRSQEIFKDFEYPQKFAGVLSVLYDDRQGNTLYRVPRRYPARARVVEARKLNALKPPRANDDVEYLGAYADVIEKGPDSPPTLTRDGTDVMRVRAKVAPGQSIVVQESWDPAWQAWAGGKQLPVRKDAMGFMAVETPPGNQEVRLAFVTPLENRIGCVVTVVTLALLLSLMWFGMWWEAFSVKLPLLNLLPTKLSHRRKILLDGLLLFLFTAVLVGPFFQAEYTDTWSSIESTFVSDARFLTAHWPHPQWQPLWYAGTRFDYIYPPAVRYGTAVISKVTGFWPVKAYHFYVAFFYALGIAGVYLLMRVGSKSRPFAYLGALATSLMSPIFLFLPRFRDDAWMLQPQRLGVLVKYGDGPHMSALALIPIALAFGWLALEKHRPWAVALAAVFSAGVAANNFFGAIALATFYPILVWSLWITRREKRIVVPAIAIPVLAYGLTAFWLVPSYFKVTAENLKYVSEHGTTWSIWVAVAVAVAFAVASDRFARAKPERAWAVFIAGCVVFFSLNVLGGIYFNFRISGDPVRLLPELDMIYIMAAVLMLRWLWGRPGIDLRAVVLVILIAAFWTTTGYIRHAWHMFPLSPDYQDRIEYRITDWLWKNMPDARAYPSGYVRFWYDAWHDLPQLSGGSDQGLLNGELAPAQWETNLGAKPEPAILWMQCMGVDVVYVSDKRSQEMFKDFEHPEKFAGVLPVVYDDGRGNTLYRVPRRFPARARVVETRKLNALKPPRANDDVEYLGAYADVIEKGPDSPPTLTRDGTDSMRVRAKVGPGQSIVVQESWDPAWQAWAGGNPLPIRKDAMGFMAVDAPPGDREIRLAFVTPLENRVGRVATLATLVLLLGLVVFGRRWERFV